MWSEPEGYGNIGRTYFLLPPLRWRWDIFCSVHRFCHFVSILPKSRKFTSVRAAVVALLWFVSNARRTQEGRETNHLQRAALLLEVCIRVFKALCIEKKKKIETALKQLELRSSLNFRLQTSW